MAKKKKKRSGLWFGVGMLLYALVFLGCAAFGLKWLWNCMEAYEASRTHIAIDAYMERVTKEYIVDNSAEAVLTAVDGNLQTQEECRQILLDSLDGEISYARKASACSDNEQVYVIRCGKQVVGFFSIVTGQEDAYGFTPWSFSKDSYDLSYVMGSETLTVQAPEGYAVYVNGVALDESYIISTDTEQFEELEDFYEDYDLPMFTLHTYQTGPFLGHIPEVQVLDPQGNPFTYDESFDKSGMIPVVEGEAAQELEEFVEEFLDIYVVFAGCANDRRETNYKAVIQYVVPDSSLADRMLAAVEGMQFAQSLGDKIVSIDIHRMVELVEGKYLCDVTYKVDTTGREGVVQTTNNAKIIVVESGSKLLVESMISY